MRNFNDKGVLASSEKSLYQISLEKINENDEDNLQLRNKLSQSEKDDDKKSRFDEGPPKTLKDIFKISNRNRKRNK